MKSFTLIFLTLLALSSQSCSKSEGCDEIFNTSTFSLDKKYCINDYAHMTIDSIKDSRCPVDAICVWAGEAAIYVTWFDEDVFYHDVVKFEAVAGQQVFKNLAYDGLKISIDEVGPYPTGAIFDNKDYYIKMKVEND